MKKLLVCAFAILFVASLVMAQNVANVSETGDYNTATVTQTGSNTATVTQLSISPGTFGKGNTATIQQIGIGNESTVYEDRQGGQQSNQTTAWVYQSGDNNTSWIQQDGYYQGSNSAVVTQLGVSGGSGNQADIEQKNNYGNYSEIYQEGDQNYGYQYSNTVTSGNQDYIEQIGLRHHAEQWAYGSDDQHMTALQYTSDNYSYQYQSGLKHEAIVYQDGTFNNAYQYQYNGSYKFGGVYARQHYASITQIGNTNYAYQYQDEQIPDVWADSRNTSTIYQEGDQNNATVNQYDGLNAGDISQTGSFNQASVDQYSQSNTATVTQTGNSNVATVTQN